MRIPAYRTLRFGHDLLHAAESVSTDWVGQAWEQAARTERRGITVLLLPGGAGAILKVYRLRPRHGYWRRLRASRAVLEGAGYRAFRARGIPTPSLLFYGERRRFGLWEFGAVATARVDARSVSEAFSLDRDEGLLMEAASVLADVHRAELIHGDPRLRNFLATRPRPMPFDLPSWGPLTGSSQIGDLVRFLGSTLVLSGDEALTREVLDEYLREGPRPSADVGSILEAAATYAVEKGVP